MTTVAPTPAFPFPTLSLDKGKLLDFMARCRAAGIHYEMGAKVPHHGAVPGKDFGSLDCSGFVDEALWLASGGKVDMPEGSWYEQDAVEKAGFKQTRIDSGLCRDGIVRIAFLPQSRANHDRHVVLILDGWTLESSGGIGPNRRLWGSCGWMDRCDVYVLTAPGAK